jgi:serine/threonine protein kinase
MQTHNHILPPGKELDNGTYKVVRHLGSGGFGITYLAQNRLGRHVVIKEMYLAGHCVRNTDNYQITLQNITPDSYTRHKERFRNEGLALLKFNHPNIVRVEELFEENGTLYLVMEYIDGRNLEEIREQQGYEFSEAETLKITRQIMDALQVVHDQQVYHRDVKPANVMVDQNGVAKLIDFGISKQVDENITMTQTKAFSKYYAAPEQQAGAKPSALFDVYGLSATMYFMLTGKRPMDVSERATDDFATPQEVKPSISNVVSEVVMRGLSLKPAERWPDIPTMRAALQENRPNGGRPSSDDHTHIDQPASRPQPKPQPAPSSPLPPQPSGLPLWLRGIMYGIVIIFGGVGIGALALNWDQLTDGGPSLRVFNRDSIALLNPKVDSTTTKPAETPATPPPATTSTNNASPDNNSAAFTSTTPKEPKSKPERTTGQPVPQPYSPTPTPQRKNTNSINPDNSGDGGGYNGSDLGTLIGSWRSRDDDASYNWTFGGSGDGGKFGMKMTMNQDNNITVYFNISGIWQKTGSNTITTRYGKVNCIVDVDGKRVDLRNMDSADLDAEQRGQLSMLVTIMDNLEGESVSYTVRNLGQSSVSLVDGSGSSNRLSRL